MIPQVAESADCRGRNMFATETNCCFDVDDVNGLTIFCDRYGATLSIGGSQLLAWYKVDLKPGSIAKGDYVFNGYLYISCNDFAKLKPILVERGWSFHDTKSGPPFFAEGEVGTEPTESPSHPAKIEDNKASVDANEVNKERGVAQTSTSEEVLLDEDSLTPKPLGILVRAECTADSEQLHKRRGRLTNSRFFFALAVMLCVIAYGVYVLMVQRCKEIEKSKHPPQIVQGATNHGVAATPDDGGKPLHKPDAGPHVIGTQDFDSQLRDMAGKQCLGVQRAANKAKIAGAKKYAVIEWNAGVKEWERGNKCFSSQDFVGATNCFAEAKKRFDVAMQQCHNAIENLKTDAERRRLRVQDAANKAKSVGAKEHAIPEWNGAVGKWNSGDDKFNNGDYVGALELYHLSESLFVEAERISQSRKAVKLTAKLSELQGKASALVEESDKWWKWSVDDSALLEMGNAINKSLYEGENIPSFSIANRNELEMLLVRCYELASKGGSGEASFRLALLYGAAENLVNPYSGVVIRRDNKLAEQYLKRAIAQKHALAKRLYDAMH